MTGGNTGGDKWSNHTPFLCFQTAESLNFTRVETSDKEPRIWHSADEYRSDKSHLGKDITEMNICMDPPNTRWQLDSLEDHVVFKNGVTDWSSTRSHITK